MLEVRDLRRADDLRGMSASPCAPARSSACSGWSAAAAPRSPRRCSARTPADGGRDPSSTGATCAIASPPMPSRTASRCITEDRKRDGLALDASVIDNAGLATMGAFAQAGILDAGASAETGRREARRAQRPPARRRAGRCGSCQRRQPAEGRAGQMAAGREHCASSSSTSRRAASTSPPRSRSTA